MTINRQAPRRYKSINKELFNQISRLRDIKKVKEIVETTEISKSRIYEIIHYLDTDENPSYESFMKKKCPKKQKFSVEKVKIREISSRDIALTQRGVQKN